MFGGSMMEATLNEVCVADFSEKIVEAMLQFMYTGEVVMEEKEDFMLLLIIADKYDVYGLKELCECQLKETVCVENAASLLEHANFFRATTILKPALLDFINR
jgi:speckle-type POZ protein